MIVKLVQRIKIYASLSLCMMLNISAFPQIEFDFRFNSTANEVPRNNFIQSSDSSMLGLINIQNRIDDSTLYENNLVLKLSQEGDTLTKSFLSSQGVKKKLNTIVQIGTNPIRYLLTGITYPDCCLSPGRWSHRGRRTG